jgi:LuxR family quorum sensing-dependent transcriptional regulator
MSDHRSDFVDDAFDLMDQIEGMTAPDAIQRALLTIIGQFGFTYLMMSRLPVEKTRLAPNMLVRLWPEDFLARYDRKHYLRDDPMAAHCFTTLNPFLWSDVRFDAVAEPRAAMVMNEAGEARLRQGFSLPVHDKHGFQACISMAGDRVDLPARARRTLHLISLFAFGKIDQLGGARPVDVAALSRREREVLTWIAAGYTRGGVADKLRIAATTVETHLARAREKLGTLNTVHTVVEALRSRQLSL